MPNIVNEKTLIPIGIVLSLVGAVFSFGVLYQQVKGLEDGQQRIESRIARIESILIKPIAYEPFSKVSDRGEVLKAP